MAKTRYVYVAALNPNVSDDVEIREARTKVTELVPRFYEPENIEYNHILAAL